MVRDAVGIDCLYYRDQGSTLDVSHTLIDLNSGADFNDAFLAGALLSEFPEDLTPYAGVSKVPPGSIVTWRPGRGTQSRRWWRLPEPNRAFERVDTYDLAARLRDEIHAAVGRCITDARGPVAVEHSGGLDSATIAAVATQIMGPVVGYTLSQGGSAETDLRERPVLRAVEERCALEPRTSPAAPGAQFDGYAPIGPRPQASWLPRTRLAHLAGAEHDGVNTLLSGWGGDQGASYSGEGYLVDQAMRLRWVRGGRLLAANAEYRRRSRKAAIKAEYTEAVVVPRDARRSRDLVAAMASPQLRAHMSSLSSPRVLLGAEERRRSLWRTGHVGRKVEYYAWDLSAMNMIYAYPMLDRQLIELVMSIPARRWMDDGRHRGLFRIAMADLVPERVLDRPTKGEPNPNWAEAAQTARERHREKLNSALASERVRGYLPGLSAEAFEALDLRRRLSLLQVADLLQDPFWTPNH